MIYSSHFAINLSVNNPLRHACRHAKGDEVDWSPYKIRHQLFPSRLIMISNSQCITEEKMHIIQTFGNTRFECSEAKSEKIHLGKNTEYYLEIISLICEQILLDKMLGICEASVLFRRVHFSCITKKYYYYYYYYYYY